MHAGRYHVHPGGRPLRLTLGLRPRQRHAADILAPSCRRPFMCFCLLLIICYFHGWTCVCILLALTFLVRDRSYGHVGFICPV